MLILAVFLAVAGIFDLFFRRIPNILSLALLAVCVVFTAGSAGFSDLGRVLLRILVTGAVFYPFYAIGVLGAGDVKLMAVSCGFFAGDRCLVFLFLSLLIAAGTGIVKMGLNGEMGKRMHRLAMYLGKMIRTGKVERYHCNRQAALKSGVALAGPMFISALIGIGGFY